MHQGESSQQGRQFEKGESSRAGGGGGEVSVQGDLHIYYESQNLFTVFLGIEIGESSQQGIVEDGNALHNRFNQINKKVLELLENYGNIPSPLYINHHLPSEILSLNNPNNSIREQYNNLILTYKYFIEANIMNIEYENNILQNIINAK
uniref:Uncharacterized protein n=1 Tax=Meloidogyne hapla TaxID=6305 RepID=A0A1I8BRF5_MELHA